MYIKNLIGNGNEGGLFYTSQDSFEVKFTTKNITLYNLYQENKQATSIIYIDKNNTVHMDG